MRDELIPKKLHYIWLGGGEKNDHIKACMESWKQQLPDWEIIEWNDEMVKPIIENVDFARQSYEKGMYAFTSDYIRLYALYTQGGVYVDTDVMVYKPLDEFLNNEAFTGFEEKNYPATALMGAKPYNKIIGLMMWYYQCIDFKTYPKWQDYIKYQETSTCIYSNIFSMLGVDRLKDTTQHIKDFTVYPSSYFFTKGEGWSWHSFTR